MRVGDHVRVRPIFGRRDLPVSRWQTGVIAAFAGGRVFVRMDGNGTLRSVAFEDLVSRGASR